MMLVTIIILLLKVEGSVRFLDGVKNCTDSVHKFSRAFLLCYEFVQFLTPSKNLTDPSTFTHHAERLVNPKVRAHFFLLILDTPEHVDSENIKLKIRPQSLLDQLFSKRDF
jgi:hypothetical protein